MKKVKLALYILVGIILLSVAAVVMINLFDEAPYPNPLTLANLPPATFAAGNGYYVIWGLSEPDSVDLKSEAYTTPFKRYFDPAIRDEKAYYQIFKKDDRKKFSKYSELIKTVRFPENRTLDWFSTISPQLDTLEKAREGCAPILGRYNDLLNAPVFQDFTYPAMESPTPNLLAILRTSKLYTGLCIAKAIGGEWHEAAAGLINQAVGWRRFLPYSRVLINTLIARAVIDYSLQGLISMLNHPDCPGEVASLVLTTLAPLKFEEYSTRNCFIYDALAHCAFLDDINNTMDAEKKKKLLTTPDFLGELFYQKNRTKNYFYEYYSRALKYDRQDPYLWQDDPGIELRYFVESKTSGLFWKLKNPVGKVFFAIAASSTNVAIFKGLRLRAILDMVRILAELKLKYRPGDKIEDLLPQLETYKAIDPGSGKPYKWNAEKKLLYGIGTDRIDNRGEVILTSVYNTDWPVPVNLR